MIIAFAIKASARETCALIYEEKAKSLVLVTFAREIIFVL